MISQDIKPLFKQKVVIEGNCLFLMGPIGTFFARLSNYLEENNVRTHKISFPLYEYGFPKSRLIKFHQDIYLFKNYLKKILIEKEIKHIFMYGNVLIPHRKALELVKELKKEEIHVKTHIFEEILQSSGKRNLEQIVFKNWGILKDRWLTKKINDFQR